MKISRWLALAGLLVTAGLAPVAAHPQSTTEVVIALKGDARVLVEITADAEPLLKKLQIFSASSSSDIQALAPTLIEHVDLRLDGSPVALSFRGASPPQNGRTVIELAGLLPENAAHLSWSSTLVFGSYPVVVRRGDTAAPAVWLQNAEVSPSISLASFAPPRGFRALWSYFQLGYTHILPHGLDHILFVLGLFLLNRRAKPVLIQVSAFTIAHSITLGLSLYGVFSLSPSIVEPLIALSIAYVAIENLFTSSVRPWRVALVFGFGLLHGLGFAEAIARLDLPRSEFFTTLVMFNTGVEAGQLTVIAVATVVVAALRLSPEHYRRRIVWPASAAIGAMGIFWTVTRLPWFNSP